MGLTHAMGAKASCCSPEAKDAKSLEPLGSDTVPVSDEPIAPAKEQADAKSDGTFVIILDKTGGKKIGIDVDHLAETGCLPIRAVNGGLAAEWNAANPDKQVNPDDTIIEVNGAKDSVSQLLERCKHDDVLHIT